jgi:methyltransferase (TIGR00027 family)
VQESLASGTALRVALRRAAHQIYDCKPLVFEDPFAVPILGQLHLEDLKRTPQRTDRLHSKALRAWIVARSRYAEDVLAESTTRGVTQYVALGAGLDTFCLRNGNAGLRVFEVDHPATQAWKRNLLKASGLTLPTSVQLTPIDFERQSLDKQLTASGFDPHARTVFAWLGVVPYLSLGAFRSTLAFIAQSVPGSELVMDYGQPRAALPFNEQLAHDSLAFRVQRTGEPFQLFFTPKQMAAELFGFQSAEDLGREELNLRYFAGRNDGLQLLGSAGRLVAAKL